MDYPGRLLESVSTVVLRELLPLLFTSRTKVVRFEPALTANVRSRELFRLFAKAARAFAGVVDTSQCAV